MTLDHAQERFDYNAYGELQFNATSINNSDVYSYNLERDKLGRITKKMEMLQGVTTQIEYKYSASGELSEVWTNGALTEKYSFDIYGNRTEGRYNEQDELTEYKGYSYEYAEDGGLKTRNSMTGTRTFDYDYAGNLLKVELENGNIIEYLSDAKNRRISKKINGTSQTPLSLTI